MEEKSILIKKNPFVFSSRLYLVMRDKGPNVQDKTVHEIILTCGTTALPDWTQAKLEIFFIKQNCT